MIWSKGRLQNKDKALDRAIEAANGGSNQVLAPVSHTPAANSEIELLTTTPQAATTALG